MRGAIWLAAAAIIVAITVSGCERERNIPEPKVPEKAQLPAINERIEREADQGTRPGTPVESPGETDRPSIDRETGR